jgi:hypothetical protein
MVLAGLVLFLMYTHTYRDPAAATEEAVPRQAVVISAPWHPFGGSWKLLEDAHD